MKENEEPNISQMKARLRTYDKRDVMFNEPHFTEQLLLREGDRDQVINSLINPENLVWYCQELGKYGDIIYALYLKINEARTIKLPVIFDKNGKKGLYILTYVMRYRNWQSMVKRS